MNDSELLIQNVNRIVSSLELTVDIQRRIIISLVQLASFSKSKNLLLKELYSYDCDADSIEPEINQMLAFGLLKEGTLNRKVRLTLVRDLWKLKPDNVESIVKTVKSIVNKNYEYDFIKVVKEVKKNLVRYKLIDQAISNKTLKIITTCSLVRSAAWGFVDNVVVRVEKSLGVVVQDKLFSDLSFKGVSQSVVEANNDFEEKKIVKKPINKTSKRSMPMLTDPSKILSVAKEILSLNRSGMHVDAIAAEAVNTNRNMGMTADEMSKKLSQALSQNVKAKIPVIVRVLNKNGTYKRGVYKLKQVRSAPLHAQIEPPQVDTGYFGKAGEYAVSSELLFWGYNVSLNGCGSRCRFSGVKGRALLSFAS